MSPNNITAAAKLNRVVEPSLHETDACKLIRFNQLQSSNRYANPTTLNNNEQQKLRQEQRNKQHQTTTVASNKQAKLMTNKLSTIALRQNQILPSNISSLKEIVHDVANITKNGESFQIVWTGLSFEVSLTNYDKLINTSLDYVKSICQLGGATSCWRTNKRSTQQKDDTTKNRIDPFRLEQATTKTSQQVKQPSTATKDSLGPQSKLADLGFDRRVIFENLNGYINSGEISAILGPSGAGKTSLLNAICGRTENYRGRIRLIGGGHTKRMRLSIIPQKDYLIENLTVRENLLYSSRLLNPNTDFDHEANILRVVRMLNLTACFNSAASNISGGEYKRVSIAQELLRQPDILILDEPTSGLDSLNCKNLIGSLVKLIKASRDGLMKPIAIVMTIHQPDVDVFHMFDHVYCMARGGRVIYDGHPKNAMQIVRSQANLTTDQRLSSQLASDSKSMSKSTNNTNIDLLGQSDSHVTTNPANLLIEIASEDLYGQEPIDRLAKYQLKQFEQMYDGVSGGIMTPDSSQRGAKTLSQLQVNLLSANHQLETNKDQSQNNPSSATSGQLGEQQTQPIRLSPLTISTTAAKQSNNNNNIQQQRSLSSSPSISTNSNASSNVSDKSSIVSTTTTTTTKSSLVRDKRLNAKNDHSGLFWYHTKVLAQRAFVSTLRDPLMTLISLAFHLFIPFVMWTVYPRKIGYTNGCPISQREFDIVSMASNRTADKLEELQEQVTTTLECSTMFFLTTYSFSMCSLSVASLAFPLNMHILLKEVRNGWYNLPTYVLAKTIANFPFEVLFPVISLVMIYVMLGMPSSPYEWRLWAMALVMALISMISHTQGLIFGALCMDSVQTAIFLASASSLPQTLLSGFTARIKHMPWVLQRLSWFSQYRYSSDIINMVRFGFDICPCDSTTDEYLRTRQPEFTDIPSHLKPMFIYYLKNNTPDPAEIQNLTIASNETNSDDQEQLVNNTTLNNLNSSLLMTEPKIPGVDYQLMLNPTERYELLTRMETNEVDLFARMADMISRSFSFGRKLEGCQSVRSQILVTGGTPTDDYLPLMFGCMFGLLVLGKILLFIVVRYKIGSRI